MNHHRGEFHGNMVIRKNDNNRYDGFGFFGHSNHGKTPLSCALAIKFLTENQGETIYLFDDNFKLENGNIFTEKNNWVGKDLLGFQNELRNLCVSREDCNPTQMERYNLDNVIIYLLLFENEDDTLNIEEGEQYKKEEYLLEQFIPILNGTNPCWGDENRNEEIKHEFIKEKFENLWTFYTITRKRYIDDTLKYKIINNQNLTDEDKIKKNNGQSLFISLAEDLANDFFL